MAGTTADEDEAVEQRVSRIVSKIERVKNTASRGSVVKYLDKMEKDLGDEPAQWESLMNRLASNVVDEQKEKAAWKKRFVVGMTGLVVVFAIMFALMFAAAEASKETHVVDGQLVSSTEGGMVQTLSGELMVDSNGILVSRPANDSTGRRLSGASDTEDSPPQVLPLAVGNHKPRVKTLTEDLTISYAAVETAVNHLNQGGVGEFAVELPAGGLFIAYLESFTYTGEDRSTLMANGHYQWGMKWVLECHNITQSDADRCSIVAEHSHDDAGVRRLLKARARGSEELTGAPDRALSWNACPVPMAAIHAMLERKFDRVECESRAQWYEAMWKGAGCETPGWDHSISETKTLKGLRGKMDDLFDDMLSYCQPTYSETYGYTEPWTAKWFNAGCINVAHLNELAGDVQGYQAQSAEDTYLDIVVDNLEADRSTSPFSICRRVQLDEADPWERKICCGDPTCSETAANCRKDTSTTLNDDAWLNDRAQMDMIINSMDL